MADDMIRKTEEMQQRNAFFAPQRCAMPGKAGTVLTRRKCCLSPVAFFLLSAVVCPLNAETLPDPTRLPPAIAAPTQVFGVEDVKTGLQAIFISGARRAAIIDGETVELGGKHGDAKLIEVNEGSIVLQGAEGRKVLTLFPGINMTRTKEKTAKNVLPAVRPPSGAGKGKR